MSKSSKPKITLVSSEGIKERIKPEDIVIEGNKITIISSDVKLQEKKAKELFKLIRPTLQKDINKSVEDALALYDSEYLDILIAKVKEGEKMNIVREEGCINFNIGRRKVNLS